MSTTESLAPYGELLLTASELLVDHQPFHSEFQLRWMVVARNGGTVFGCYKQVLREIEARLLALNDCQTETSSRSNSTTPGTVENCIAEITRKRSVDFIRELAILCDLGSKLKAQIGVLSNKRRACLEMELWSHRAKSLAALDLLAQGQVGRETLEFICAFPAPQKQELLNMALDPANHSQLIEVFLSESQRACVDETENELFHESDGRFVTGVI